VASTFYTISHRPADHFGFIATSPIQLLLFFAFFRNRFELQLAVCLLSIGADLFTLLALRVPMGTPMLVQVGMTYGLAMLVGVLVSYQLKHSRRRLFGVLLSEREMGEAMRELAYRDELTGVLNRRRFLQQAGAAWRDRAGPGCVLILDLDHFKELNDRHGHDAGDQALVRFARMVEAVKRDVDVFGRIGGEEFALLLPGLPQAQAQVIADAIVAGCRALQAGQGESLSVSIGLAVILPTDAGLAATMLRADRALYRAKEEGRGRSCAADGVPGTVVPQGRHFTRQPCPDTTRE
jgi:diguanylate cyclase (GGDEF)-like protein